MALRHHFIIAIEDGRLMLEPSSCDCMLADDMTILDTETKQWFTYFDKTEENDKAYGEIEDLISQHNSKEGDPHSKAITYAVIVEGAAKDFLFGTLDEVFVTAREQYGPSASIREAYYGEWECGDPETGLCWYDEKGIHHFRNGVPCSECGSRQPEERLTPVNSHGERFCAVCE